MEKSYLFHDLTPKPHILHLSQIWSQKILCTICAKFGPKIEIPINADRTTNQSLLCNAWTDPSPNIENSGFIVCRW